MTKRMLAIATSILMGAPLIPVAGFAQAPATPAAPAPATPAPATPAPAAPATPAAPAAPAPSTAAPAPSAAAKPHHPPMHTAATREHRVERLQTALNANGASLTVDGKMGPKTRSALMDFQKSHNLPATGRVDKATRAALMKPAS